MKRKGFIVRYAYIALDVALVAALILVSFAWRDAERRYEDCMESSAFLALAGFYAVEGDMDKAKNNIDISIATRCLSEE